MEKFEKYLLAEVFDKRNSVFDTNLKKIQGFKQKGDWKMVIKSMKSLIETLDAY